MLRPGTAVWHPGTPEEERLPDAHPAIVTPAEFDEARAVSERNARRPGRRGTKRPLSHLARCHYCGASFKGSASGHHHGYRRMMHQEGRPCGRRRKSFSAPVLERQLGDVLGCYFTLPDDWRQHVVCVAAQPDPHDPHQAERVQVERALARLRDLYQFDPDLTRAEYEARKSELRRRLAALPTPPRLTQLPDLEQAAALLSDLRALWLHDGVSLEARRELVGEVFEELTIDDAGIRSVTPRAEYMPLAAASSMGVLLLVGETGFEPATS